MENVRTCIKETFNDVDGYDYGGPRYAGLRVKEWSFEYSDGFIERVAMTYRPKPEGPRNTKLDGSPLK